SSAELCSDRSLVSRGSLHQPLKKENSSMLVCSGTLDTFIVLPSPVLDESPQGYDLPLRRRRVGQQPQLGLGAGTAKDVRSRSAPRGRAGFLGEWQQAAMSPPTRWTRTWVGLRWRESMIWQTFFALIVDRLNNHPLAPQCVRGEVAVGSRLADDALLIGNG